MTLAMTTLLAIMLAVVVLLSGYGILAALLAYAFGGSGFLLMIAGSAHFQAEFGAGART
jgi:hypothetical protein